MTGIEYLMQANMVRRKVEIAERKMERYKVMTERLSPMISGEQVSHSRNLTLQEDTVLQYMAAKEEFCTLKWKHEHIVSDIEEKLGMLTNQEDEYILRQRYICQLPMAVIAKEIHINRQHLYKRHNAAIHELEALLATEAKETT